MPKTEKGVGDLPLAESSADPSSLQKFSFPPETPKEEDDWLQFRRVPVPSHRMTPLKKSWMELYKPITELLLLDMRMNLKTRKVEIKTTKQCRDAGLLQKAADFVNAFILGFEVKDAIALLRLDDLFVESFEIKDVKTLQGEHLSRCIGRLAGKSGKTKFTIENASHTRIVIANTKIHILGSFQNVRFARSLLLLLWQSINGTYMCLKRCHLSVDIGIASRESLWKTEDDLFTGPRSTHCVTSLFETAAAISCLLTKIQSQQQQPP